MSADLSHSGSRIAAAMLAEKDAGRFIEPGQEWIFKRPATTIVGSFKPEIVAAPGYRTTVSRQNARGSVRVTVHEAGVLQSFPRCAAGARTPRARRSGRRGRAGACRVNPDVCIHCAATGCVDDTAVHTTACPFTTGLWPVDADMVELGCVCAACEERFVVGEFYAETSAGNHPAVTHAATLFRADAVLVVCVPCAAIGAAIT